MYCDASFNNWTDIEDVLNIASPSAREHAGTAHDLTEKNTTQVIFRDRDSPCSPIVDGEDHFTCWRSDLCTSGE